MPLLDHFRPPLGERRPWESFHTTWASAIADTLNDGLLPAGYIALEQIHWAPVSKSTSGRSPNLPRARAAAPPRRHRPCGRGDGSRGPPCRLSAQRHGRDSLHGGRPDARRRDRVGQPWEQGPRPQACACLSPSATYLARGVGLVVVDVVTSRRGNLHNELVGFLAWMRRSAWRTPLRSTPWLIGRYGSTGMNRC